MASEKLATIAFTFVITLLVVLFFFQMHRVYVGVPLQMAEKGYCWQYEIVVPGNTGTTYGSYKPCQQK